MPTLVLNQNRTRIDPRIGERRFSIRVDAGPWFRVTHVRPEGDDPISLSILLDPSAMDLMPNLSRQIADLAPIFLTPRDHVSLYSLGCGLTRSLDDKPADNARLLDRVDTLLAPWRAPGENNPHCTQQPVYLWDALTFISTRMEELPGRRVILVLTDGLDKGSVRKWNEVRGFVQIASIAVFGITMQARSSSGTAPVSLGTDVYPFLSICELSGGILMPTTPELIEATLLRAMAMLRERYILEFPRPSNSTQGVHSVEVKIAGGEKYYVRPTGVTVPLPDDSVLKDLTTVPSDPSRTPEQGKRRVLTQPGMKPKN
jgi:hypothetical protein